MLVGGWTNPSEKYARQIGSWIPRDRGENSKNLWVATNQLSYILAKWYIPSDPNTQWEGV